MNHVPTKKQLMLATSAAGLAATGALVSASPASADVSPNCPANGQFDVISPRGGYVIATSVNLPPGKLCWVRAKVLCSNNTWVYGDYRSYTGYYATPTIYCSSGSYAVGVYADSFYK